MRQLGRSTLVREEEWRFCNFKVHADVSSGVCQMDLPASLFMMAFILFGVFG